MTIRVFTPLKERKTTKIESVKLLQIIKEEEKRLQFIEAEATAVIYIYTHIDMNFLYQSLINKQTS